MLVNFGSWEDRATPPVWALLIPFGLLIATLTASAYLLYHGTRVVEITRTDITFEEADSQFVTAVETGRAQYERQMQEWLERKPPGAE